MYFYTYGACMWIHVCMFICIYIYICTCITTFVCVFAPQPRVSMPCGFSGRFAFGWPIPPVPRLPHNRNKKKRVRERRDRGPRPPARLLAPVSANVPLPEWLSQACLYLLSAPVWMCAVVHIIHICLSAYPFICWTIVDIHA